MACSRPATPGVGPTPEAVIDAVRLDRLIPRELASGVRLVKIDVDPPTRPLRRGREPLPAPRKLPVDRPERVAGERRYLVVGPPACVQREHPPLTRPDVAKRAQRLEP